MAEEDKVLFEVRQEHMESGLRGIPVGFCTTSTVDPQKGLYYVERPVSSLALEDPEKVIYLLLFGEEPNRDQLSSFKADLVERSFVSPEVLESIQKLPRKGHPMKLFPTSLLLLGMLEGTGNYIEDCLNLVAKVPVIAATLINSHAGWESKPSRPEIGYMENFTEMLGAPNVNLDVLTKVMRVFNVLHYDHGGGNLSTFVGKAVASGMEDLFGSLSAAMNALAGPRHGKANQDCLEFVQHVLEKLGPNTSQEDVESLVRRRLENKELVFGFGHAVLRVEDPRATIFYQLAEDLFPEHPLVKVANLLRTEGARVLKENPKVSNPYPNVDAMSGTVLTAAGFPYPEYYTVLFGLSRVVGIARQIVYERCEAREGKGTPIVRPKYLYKKSLSTVFQLSALA